MSVLRTNTSDSKMMQQSIVAELVNINYRKLKIELDTQQESQEVSDDERETGKTYKIFGGIIAEHMKKAIIVINYLDEIRRQDELFMGQLGRKSKVKGSFKSRRQVLNDLGRQLVNSN